jgi:predicted nucleotidyltransferase
MNPRLNITDDQLAAFCRKWKIVEVWLFGSILRDDFTPQSDVDVLIEIEPGARFSTFDQAVARQELAGLLGRRVDLFTKRSVEASPERAIRKEILSSARRIFAA